MSTGEKIQAVGAIVGLAGLIWSIWSLRKATFASVYQGIAGQMHEIDKLFVEKPELRPYFYGDTPLPEDCNERQRVLATAELIIDFADNLVAQRPFLPRKYERGYDDYLRELYGSSLAMQRFWSDCGKRWYKSEELNNLFRDPPAPTTSGSASADAQPV